MKTIEELIAKQMSVINVNMIHTIQSTLTKQTLQDTTQEKHQSPNNISQYPLTQPPNLATTTTNEDINIEYQTTSEGTKRKTNVNSKRKQDDQLCPEETQDTIPDDRNDTFMEDQDSITLPNQRIQTRLSPHHRRESREKSSLVLPKTLSRLGKTRKWKIYVIFYYK